MAYRGIKKQHRDELLGVGLTEATVEVAVLRIRHPRLTQGQIGRRLGMTQQGVSNHLAIAREVVPQWSKHLSTRRGRPSRQMMAQASLN